MRIKHSHLDPYALVAISQYIACIHLSACSHRKHSSREPLLRQTTASSAN